VRFRTITTYRFTRQITALAWLLCVALSSMSVFAIEAPNRDDVVFCPLQRQWVAKAAPRIVEEPGSLSNICGSAKSKTDFLRQLAAAVPKSEAGHRVNTNELFFNFQIRGYNAFLEIRRLPNEPKTPLLFIEKSPGGITSRGNSNKYALVTERTSSISKPSPTIAQDPVSHFLSPVEITLQSVIVSADPRGPPVS
jgi:hypothetical protein